MKIKNLAIIIILMTIFFMIIGTKVYSATGVINDGTVDLKKAPDSKTILDYVYEGDEVEILEHEDGWYKVIAQTEQGRVTGYISEEFIDVESNTEPTTETNTTTDTATDTNTETNAEANSETESENSIETSTTSITNIEEEKQYVLQQEISVKAMPLINSREKAKIIGNVTVIEIINNWVRIESDIESGWVRKNNLLGLLTNTETTIPQQSEQENTTEENTVQTSTEETQPVSETEEEETVTELNKTGYVNAEGLRVRKEPTTDSEEIHSLSRNNEVEITGQIGNWYRINLNGEIGYVSAKYISDTKLPETTSRSGSTLKNTTTTETTKTETQAQTTEITQSTSGTKGEEVVEYAKQYLGYKYVSGGASPSTGFDCSGFTSYVYKHFGVSLNRTSRDQIKNGVAVEKSALLPGDILVFNNSANNAIGHVGIYIGNGNFIHAANSKQGVIITQLDSAYYEKRYVGARRVI